MLQRILNIVAWLGTALVVAGAAAIKFAPQYDRYARWMVWAGLVCVFLYPIGLALSGLNRRQSKYATITFTSVVIVLGILVAVNYLSNRRFKRWDLTTNLVNSLSEQSLKVVGDLKTPIKLVIVDVTEKLDQYRGRMSMYENASRQVSVEYFDPYKDPIRATKYALTNLPSLVVEYMGRTEKAAAIEERDITSAIIRAVNGQARKVYFVQGHGEPSPTGASNAGFSGVAGLLKGNNVTVETLVLTQHKDVPEDATVLVIAGPTTDLLDQEIEQIKAYLAKGGKLLAMLDPDVAERPQPTARLTALLAEWGVEVSNNVVIDASGRSNDPSLVVAFPPYPNHPITDGFQKSTIYPVARMAAPVAKAPEGKTVQPLVQTAPDAWAETDIAGLRAGKPPELNADKGDKAGPVTVATTVTAAVATPAPAKKDGEEPPTPPQTRIAVFGNARFATDTVAGNLGNADLFLNTVSWLSAQENLIAIRPREPHESRLEMTPNQSWVVGLFAVAIVPLLVFGAGVMSWARRRRS
jgi:ABC-type uncharacterized transport system involved in gliding motility auxiliary subunit